MNYTPNLLDRQFHPILTLVLRLGCLLASKDSKYRFIKKAFSLSEVNKLSIMFMIGSMNRIIIVNMPQVSRQPLERSIQTEIYSSLYFSLASLSSESDVEHYLSELLTPTEKMMLAKRLAIAILLEQGYEYREIHQVLKVSTSTIATVSHWMKISGQGYRKVIADILKNEKWKHIFALINEFLSGFKQEFGRHPQVRKML